MPSHVEHHEEEQHEDAYYFDDGAPEHSVVYIIEKIDRVAGHGQHDESIQLPELIARGWRMEWGRRVFHWF